MGGGGGVGEEVTCGGGGDVNVVRVCEPVFRNLPPFIYLAFEKNRPIHIHDRPKC